MSYTNLIKSFMLASVIAFGFQAIGGAPVDMRATPIVDGASYTSEGAFLTLLFIEEFVEDTASTTHTTHVCDYHTNVNFKDESTTTLEDGEGGDIICERCGKHFLDYGYLYDHDIRNHGYCEEHGEYEDCYREDGSLKDCYHRGF